MSTESRDEVARTVAKRLGLKIEGHTPGPWKAGRADMQTLIEGYGGKYIYADKGSKYIAAALGCEVRLWDEVIANAHMIAAAPKLWDALIDAEMRIQELQQELSILRVRDTK